MNYAITTDSACNLNKNQLSMYNVSMLPLSYSVNGTVYSSDYGASDQQLKYFYDKLRDKADVKTSAIQQVQATEFFEDILKSGKDILHIAFSSTLSSTYAVAKMVLDELSEAYPERKIYCIDSFCAAMGEGLLVTYAATLRNEGKDIDSLHKWLENNKMNVCHLFTVDDLFFLKRGGRLSATTAVIGSVLGIKPLLKMDSEGKLVPTGKVRGRKAALNEMLNRMEQIALPFANQIVYIVHGDCKDDADFVAAEVKKRFKPKSVEINFLEPVIGAHGGPGTLAIFFMGKER